MYDNIVLIDIIWISNDIISTAELIIFVLKLQQDLFFCRVAKITIPLGEMKGIVIG